MEADQHGKIPTFWPGDFFASRDSELHGYFPGRNIAAWRAADRVMSTGQYTSCVYHAAGTPDWDLFDGLHHRRADFYQWVKFCWSSV